ncbi:PLD nuclease N-terminal domain-containing protein [Micromonospora sp. NPDC049559]|uniref:PLD nuclease N-terminal domain-containing protein n=1 Tax=Micromonospora sp. NPDC049559 TaxID=3155923 RepID=UPI00343520D9
MARLYVFLFLAQIALAAAALISCLSAEPDEIRALPRFAWVLLILFFPLLGSIAWFAAGRPLPAGRPGRPGPAGGAPTPPPVRPLAPDDDPEFLRSLSAEQSKRDREMFERWEQDLRRREEELRRHDGDETPRRDAGDPPREEGPAQPA